VVVERVRHRHERPERRPDLRTVRVGERRKDYLSPLGGIRHHRRLAARAAHRGKPAASERAMHVQQLQRFQEGRDRLDAADAEPPQERIRRRIRARQRGRVRDGSGAGLVRASDLHRDDRLAQFPCPFGKPFETGDVIEALDMQPEAGDPLVLDQAERDLGKPRLRLVARRHDIGERQAAFLHRHVDGDVGGLRDERGTTRTGRQPHAAMLVRPQQRPVAVVDHPVAVRPEDRHAAGRVHQLPLQAGALGVVGSRFEETRGEADRATRAALAKLPHHVDRQVPVDADESGVRRFRQVCHRGECLDPAYIGLCGVHRPDLAGKAHFQALRHDIGAEEAAADHGDRLWAQKTVEAITQAA
jgi:hypothetical protein